ncbi:hypothetical protein Tlie_0598 [Thermovirga lienii DSM 17291]|uniref:Regulatory protein, FmdB family n=1 Tax=Thermovirga lienii (strain ATCC BAA-1197 / DSM 17291 / Cas60314) TaxID=580340 RepID=G7V8H1_THELD|nr:hypothetical protein Tlie_0598 [Thermovirga lienii DSM 17291]HCD72305.1 hypothetical protein [Thermovirga lienii]
MGCTKEVKLTHVYRCPSCGNRFSSSSPTFRCPKCRSKFLIHEEGPPLKRAKNCRGSCSGCSGCGG